MKQKALRNNGSDPDRKELLILDRWDTAKKAIEECRSIEEVKRLRDQAELYHVYSRQVKESLELQNKIAEIRLRAERGIGKFSKKFPKRQGGDTRFGSPRDGKTVSKGEMLKKLNIDSKHIHRYEAMASLPDDVFEGHIAQVKARNDRITMEGVLKKVKDLKTEAAAKANGGCEDVVIKASDVSVEENSIEEFVERIFNENCTITMSRMPDDCIDCVITSPPYEDIRSYHGYDFNFEEIASELYRVIKPGGVVVWVVADQTVEGSESGESFRQALYFKNCGFNLHDTMIWQKPSFSNPSSNRYHQCFEYMFVFSKGKPKTFNPIKDNENKCRTPLGRPTTRQRDGSLLETRRFVGQEYGMRGNVWRLNTAAQEKPCQTLHHPAMFPEQLARDHITTWTEADNVVYDPFCGSGTTPRVAEEMGRRWIASEVSEEYCNLAANRVKGYKNIFSN